MAVPKHKISRSKRGKRRSHKKINYKILSTDIITGELHIRHHITYKKFYKGKKIL
ncbi:50S ribosomal protein L32 [Enterobacteriaceae bacterium ET-AT1-13]|nr:50S ribosomal protein L32 [Enterobacteriaceae bacterium ET-AT1-13]WGS66441.1 50S ribosomal protein L32 [Enterobacteriaceae bacterium Cmel17]WMC17466.1 MAG: 50S ribosomal protein L32 [Enterobacteriaceae bacterium Cmel21]WMC17673.1 MAG: 50S ribosomal protein L32 [Enterobacteriaceae bacterium PSmelAO3-2]WMC17877.1 MAG: 50S ribosomal protein L32 [Enterobacteriaceae bacterium PSmelAO3-1]WMC18081.1 MAG: 50S ribosomal protein L32 [Enterobacteriaceae bacterium PSmelAO1]